MSSNAIFVTAMAAVGANRVHSVAAKAQMTAVHVRARASATFAIVQVIVAAATTAMAVVATTAAAAATLRAAALNRKNNNHNTL